MYRIYLLLLLVNRWCKTCHNVFVFVHTPLYSKCNYSSENRIDWEFKGNRSLFQKAKKVNHYTKKKICKILGGKICTSWISQMDVTLMWLCWAIEVWLWRELKIRSISAHEAERTIRSLCYMYWFTKYKLVKKKFRKPKTNKEWFQKAHWISRSKFATMMF